MNSEERLQYFFWLAHQFYEDEKKIKEDTIKFLSDNKNSNPKEILIEEKNLSNIVLLSARYYRLSHEVKVYPLLLRENPFNLFTYDLICPPDLERITSMELKFLRQLVNYCYYHNSTFCSCENIPIR